MDLGCFSSKAINVQLKKNHHLTAASIAHNALQLNKMLCFE